MKKETIVWDVLFNGEVIDTVFYENTFNKQEVKEDLINKGFEPSIKLKKNTHW